MKQNFELEIESLDSAAVFASALSLWDECNKRPDLNLSECYNGIDQLMREVMRIANQFETWSCLHIAFDELDEVWPYLLEDKFGKTCLAVIQPTALSQFDETDCLRVALSLRLPIKVDGKLPVPIDICISNPSLVSAFRGFRIQTVRDLIEDGDATPFLSDDEPFDDEFSQPYFSLYGVDKDGLIEHIADRRTYVEIISLVEKLVPGVNLPVALVSTNKQPPRIAKD